MPLLHCPATSLWPLALHHKNRRDPPTAKITDTFFFSPKSHHWLCLSLTDLLTHWCCLVNLIDVTLACEDPNSKPVEVATVADDEDHNGNSLFQIWERTFGPKAKFLIKLCAQGLVNILKLKFRQNFEAGDYLAFCCWCFVEDMKLNLGRDSEAS